MRYPTDVHGAYLHAPNGPDPIPATYAIKLCGDDETIAAGTAFVWFCPKDVANTRLRDVELFASGVGGSPTTLMISNLTTTDDLLVSPLELSAGDFHSDDGGNDPDIDDGGTPPRNLVSWKDRLAFVIVDAGGASGVAVEIKFGPNRVRLTP